MKQLHDNLWIVQADFFLAGINLRNCMTIVKLDDGLFVHSPIPYTQELKLPQGDIKILFAPNRFHTLFFPEWKQAFPDAQIYAPTKKVNYDIRIDEEVVNQLNSQYTELWLHKIAGLPLLGEIVCLHHPSKSLILTDLCFNHRHGNLLSKIFFWLYGSYGKFGPTRMIRYLINKRPKEFKQSLDMILQHDFERIILSHGEIIEQDAKDQLKQAFSWLY